MASISAAERFYELNLLREAWEELGRLPTSLQEQIEVLRLRLKILVATDAHGEVARLVDSMLSHGDRDADALLAGANGCRWSMGAAEAKAMLLRGSSWMSEDCRFHFALACYECELGNLREARRALKTARRLNPAVAEQAAAEPALRQLLADSDSSWP